MKKISVTVASTIALIMATGAAYAQTAAAPAPAAAPVAAPAIAPAPAPRQGGPGQHIGKGNFLAGADANKDGKISFEEWKTFHSERIVKDFDRLDADKDGFITDEDLEKVRLQFEAMRAASGKPGGPPGASLPLPPQAPPGIKTQ